MFSFRQRSPHLPSGFVLDIDYVPSPDALNRLLARCNEETHPSRRLALALEKSDFHLSILEESSGKLSGFVRATSDKGLNANLWNLVAEPSFAQGQLLAVLVHRSLGILRKKMPGCSVSVSAPVIALEALKENGFLIDPGGIRAMGFKLR
ncbi:N-acetyltransferase [Prochlorococcus sp. MIT 1307]|uniref:N-acetyltransferase n=1 Tax=Prochlorococcus sp. MIT 1307 TaxID=3096219 RepID=UPI002A763A9B|nr:N-acetyltransferase [Prochlorococcus sp. MIT 1307]